MVTLMYVANINIFDPKNRNFSLRSTHVRNLKLSRGGQLRVGAKFGLIHTV